MKCNQLYKNTNLQFLRLNCTLPDNSILLLHTVKLLSKNTSETFKLYVIYSTATLKGKSSKKMPPFHKDWTRIVVPACICKSVRTQVVKKKKVHYAPTLHYAAIHNN